MEAKSNIFNHVLLLFRMFCDKTVRVGVSFLTLSCFEINAVNTAHEISHLSSLTLSRWKINTINTAHEGSFLVFDE